MPGNNWRVRDGEIVTQRLFDVAYSIDLARLETLWAQRPGGASRRGGFRKTPPKAVAFDVPPLVLPLEPVTVDLGHHAHTAQVEVRVYDFGAVSIALRIAVTHCEWRAYTALLNEVDRHIGPAVEHPLWEHLLARLFDVAGAAFERPNRSGLQEDYLYGIVRAFEQPVPPASLIDDRGLVELLSGETVPLGEGTRRDLLRQRFSYYEDDLVVLTWDRAFIYDPRGDSDVADVLEIANAQLLEMRYYDELLDDELPHMYDLVEAAQRALLPGAPRRYAELARRLYGLVAEVTELKERVDNALQVTEDVYLARLYSAALDLFRVAGFSQAVDRKLAIIRDTYIALYDEASGRRAELLELTIVLLILFEIVMAFVH
ncbi:hypothetical protein G7Y82_01565 [Solimonas sp. C16B3]|uniref:DUF155 domain-containing protein n=2 Tax=Solimonas marina TaxID=2714601 RepID=A0A969W9U1_9GAMM|nr:hypothetical protein [Solimonas marina]